MSFINPLGFLGLIAIPVLILIYILKRKYTEQVISSTYIWTLSERFLKHRNPISRITGIISLILQIIVVICISLAIANPVFTLRGAANDYVFVLDGSGSMNMTTDGVSRFQRGVDEVQRRIEESADGSYYTLIVTGEATNVVFKDVDEKQTAIERLAEVEPSYMSGGYTNALTEVQTYYNSRSNVMQIVLVTDKAVQNAENVEVVNVGAQESNYAITGTEYTLASSSVTFEGTLYSYSDDASLDVDIFFDGAEQAAISGNFEVKQGEGCPFELSVGADYVNFAYAEVRIRQTDNLPDDNYVRLYHRESAASYRTLIVSDTPFFLSATFQTFGGMQRDVVSRADYNPATHTGYGLYVFDNFTPSEMPSDGAVWFVNPDANLQGSGFSRRSTERMESALPLVLNSSTSSKVQNLLKDTISTQQISVLEYVKCGIYGTFTTLATCNGDPVIFAGTNNYDNREVVLAFSLQQSTDFVLSYNYTVLMRNLINYTFPSLVEDGELYCGDNLTVNVLTGCTSIRVDSPSGETEYLDTQSASTEYELKEVGEYRVTAVINGVQQTANVFCSLPETERIVSAEEASFSIVGEPKTLRRDGRYDDILYLFIILAVLVIADWMVYCYEQYQLR